jgi:hypothetical protein
MEDCQEHMTELRKEKIEVNRELKRMFVYIFVTYHFCLLCSRMFVLKHGGKART